MRKQLVVVASDEGGGGSHMLCVDLKICQYHMSLLLIFPMSHVHLKKKAMLHSLFFKANVACRPVEF